MSAPQASRLGGRFAVVSCACGQPWSVATRHATAKCPHCGVAADLASRQRLWEGDDAMAAQSAAADLRARLAGAPSGILAPKERDVRHDSPEDAAAAKAHGITNRSDRAEAVALWLTRLLGQPTHGQLLDALQRAGLDRQRAEREVVRMLATDYLMEPRAGSYKVIDA